MRALDSRGIEPRPEFVGHEGTADVKTRPFDSRIAPKAIVQRGRAVSLKRTPHERPLSRFGESRPLTMEKRKKFTPVVVLLPVAV
jgi:hypothetical protein